MRRDKDAPSREFKPPHVVAIVQLDEGPKTMTDVVKGPCRIGDRIRAVRKERPGKRRDPLFEPIP